MLNPKLSDADRYPLKINDLIIMDVDVDLAPEKVVWSSDDDNTDRELPNVGLSGDRIRRPSNTVGDMIPYTVLYSLSIPLDVVRMKQDML